MALDELTAPVARGENATLLTERTDNAFNAMMKLVREQMEADKSVTSVEVASAGYTGSVVGEPDSDEPKVLSRDEEKSLVEELERRMFFVVEDADLSMTDKGPREANWRVKTIKWGLHEH